MDILRLTLRQLQIFVAVARRGSTTAASAQIALSQSATSSAVNELERLLSMQLFDRVGKRLLLNENGRALLPRALALLDGAADIERMARDGADQAPLLRIGASTTIGNYVLPALLSRYMGKGRMAPEAIWHSRVMIGNTAEVCEALASFELDVGLIEGPCHLSVLEATPWLHDELVVVASPSSEVVRSGAARGERVPLRVLREQVWLLREVGSGTREATDLELLPHLRSYRRSIELGSSEAIKHAVAQGLGVACLSAWVVGDLLSAKRLTRVPTTLPAMQRECHLVVHRHKQPTAALKEFVSQALCIASDK